MVSISEYLLGVAALGAIVGSVWFAAHRLRVRFTRGWSRSPAVLAEAIVFVAILLAVAQVLGAIGMLSRIPVALASLAVAGGVWLATRNRDSDRGDHEPHDFERRRVVTTTAVVLVVGLVTTPWIGRTLIALRAGILGVDSMNYHMPFAARFAKEGSILPLHFTIPGLETAFHPANSELLGAVGIVALRTDVLSTSMNLAFVGLALLAAWCIGKPRDVPLATLAASAVLLSSPLFVSFDGGRATNDIGGVALFLAAVALILNGGGSRSATALAAVASGLALGDKLTMVVPIVALTIAVIVAAERGRRFATARDWLPWLLLCGGFWYVRNLVAVGSPVPALQLGLGPVSLPAPEISRTAPAHSVAHYLFDVGVWRDWFGPGLSSALGSIWPIVVLLAVAGWFLAIVRGDRMLRALGVVGVVSMLGYLVTPEGAGGSEGRPVLFAANLRFGFPALALGLVLFPLALPAPLRVRRRYLPAAFGALALANVVRYAVSNRPSIRPVTTLAVELGLAVIVVSLLLVRRIRLPRSVLMAGAVAGLTLTVALGYVVQRAYLVRRYSTTAQALPYGGAPREEYDLIYSFARHVSHVRIGVVGFAAQYPLFGRDLSNHVQYVGHRGPHGAFDRVQSCEEWRRLLNEGRYDYVVTFGDDPGVRKAPVEAEWTRSDPSATLVEQVGAAAVFRLDGDLDSTKCAPS